MGKELSQKIYRTYMTGGTGLITLKNGKQVSVEAATLQLSKDKKYYTASDPLGNTVCIEIHKIVDVCPAQ